MNILVCIKQIPATIQGNTFAMNRFDEYALEEAVQIKERFLDQGHDAAVDVITMGPEKASEIIKRAFGIGADNGFHILTDKNQDWSSALTAKILDQTLRQQMNHKTKQKTRQNPRQLPDKNSADLTLEGRSYDLVLTGIISQDRMEGQTGPILAEHMGIACVTGVVKISFDSQSSDVMVEREMDRGEKEQLSITLPALLTVQAGINTPRYPTLSNLLKASRKEITTVIVSQQEITRDTQTILRMEKPTKTRSGTVLEGTVNDKARALFSILRKRGMI